MAVAMHKGHFIPTNTIVVRTSTKVQYNTKDDESYDGNNLDRPNGSIRKDYKIKLNISYAKMNSHSP